jgi:hypothetical protein
MAEIPSANIWFTVPTTDELSDTASPVDVRSKQRQPLVGVREGIGDGQTSADVPFMEVVRPTCAAEELYGVAESRGPLSTFANKQAIKAKRFYLA